MEKIKLGKETKHFICKKYSEGHYFDIIDVDDKIYFFRLCKIICKQKKPLPQDGVNIAECIDNFFKVFYDNGFFYLFIGNHIYDKKINLTKKYLI